MSIANKILISVFSSYLLTGLFIILAPTVNAQTSCNTYSSGTPPPQGFGAAWNVFSAGKELLLDSKCQTSSVTFKAGSGSNTQYIYKKGYYYTSSWQTLNFQGTPAQGSTDWLVGSGTFTPNNLSSGSKYWVAYICQWDATAKKWKCGCSDNACAQSLWQLQGVKLSTTLPGNTTSPWPITVSGRHFVDRNNTPILLNGHGGAQNMMTKLQPAEYETWFAAEQANGFNAVIIAVLHAWPGSNLPAPGAGTPFTGMIGGSPDLSTPRESYFARVDQMLTTAKNHGFLVFMNMSPYRDNDTLNANGIARCRAYGQFLGARYVNYDNIVWMSGNDWEGPQGSPQDNCLQATALGIKDKDTRHLQTLWLNNDMITTGWWTGIQDFFTAYGYIPTYNETYATYNGAGGKPTLYVETTYEGEGWHPGARQLRAFAYDSSPISGTTGTFFGSQDWQFNGGWQDRLNTIGNKQMKFVPQVFAGRRWWDLVPDQGHKTVTAGYGTFHSNYNDSGFSDDFATVGRTGDGSLIMAYMPTARAITVDMTKSVNGSISKWWNPENGTYTADGGPWPNTGSHTFTPPARTGDNDWVFILEAQ